MRGIARDNYPQQIWRLNACASFSDWRQTLRFWTFDAMSMQPA